MFLLIIAFQSTLIYFQNFSPFEREQNWLSILRGARPGPRFWAVALLDLLTGLLLGLLGLSVLPSAPSFSPLARLECLAPAGIVLAGLFAWMNHWLNDAIAHIPNLRMVVWRLAAALAIGAALTSCALAAGAFLAGGQNAAQIVLAYGPGLFLFGILIYFLQALSFPLRALPLAGPALQAAVSTGLWLWWVATAGKEIAGAVTGATFPGFAGLEGTSATIAAGAVLAWVAACLLPGTTKDTDAVAAPSLLVGLGQDQPVELQVSDEEGLISFASLVVRVRREPFSLSVTDASGEQLLELGEGSIRREVLLFKAVSIPVLYTGNTFKFKLPLARRGLGPVLKLTSDGNALCVDFQKARLRLAFHNQAVLRLSLTDRQSGPFNALSIATSIPVDSHLLGCGQRFNKIDQRGGELYFLVEEGGVGYAGLAPLLRRIWGERGTFPNGEYCTSFPIPFALLEREQGRASGWFWNTYRPSWLKSDSQDVKKPEARLTVLDNTLDLFLLAGPGPLDGIQQYTGLTGRPLTPPPWVLLPWKTRTGPMTAADVREDIERYRELDIPLGQVGVENWQAIRGSYRFNNNYPDVDGLVQQARGRGYHIQIWQFPYMNCGSGNYKAGLRNGFFLRNRLGLPYHQRIFYGIAAVIDYTNPAAANWHKEIVKKAIFSQGFSGTMTDYGESVPPDCVFYNGQAGLEMRNAYPVMYSRTMQQAAHEALGEDYLVYPRAGYAASQRFITAQFPGDQDTDWDEGDGLPAAVRAMLNASMCGFPVNGSDIGGWFDALAPITTKELFIRWAEVGAFSPLMRAHGGIFGRNREPWKFDAETVEIYRRLSQEHVELFPYLYSLARIASQTGCPVVLHPALLWPGQKELYAVEDAWMLGEAMYVAPILHPGAALRTVFLPPGDWWNLLDHCPVRGPTQITVLAPLGCTPRFLRRGFPLPRFVNSFDTFSEGVAARSGRLDGDLVVWLYPGACNASFSLFDGITLDAENRPSRVGEHALQWRLFG